MPRAAALHLHAAQRSRALVRVLLLCGGTGRGATIMLSGAGPVYYDITCKIHLSPPPPLPPPRETAGLR